MRNLQAIRRRVDALAQAAEPIKVKLVFCKPGTEEPESVVDMMTGKTSKPRQKKLRKWKKKRNRTLTLYLYE